jgi:hypothetical protein
MVRLGKGVGIVPASVMATTFDPSVRVARLMDCPPSVLRVAWRHGSTVRSVAEFVAHASSHTGWLDDDHLAAGGLEQQCQAEVCAGGAADDQHGVSGGLHDAPVR